MRSNSKRLSSIRSEVVFGTIDNDWIERFFHTGHDIIRARWMNLQHLEEEVQLPVCCQRVSRKVTFCKFKGGNKGMPHGMCVVKLWEMCIEQ